MDYCTLVNVHWLVYNGLKIHTSGWICRINNLALGHESFQSLCVSVSVYILISTHVWSIYNWHSITFNNLKVRYKMNDNSHIYIYIYIHVFYIINNGWWDIMWKVAGYYLYIYYIIHTNDDRHLTMMTWMYLRWVSSFNTWATLRSLIFSRPVLAWIPTIVTPMGQGALPIAISRYESFACNGQCSGQRGVF